MAVDLSPKAGKAIFESDAGAYVAWSSADQPILTDMKVGAGMLVLQPQGLALPHYADSPKFGFVLEGKATVGLVLAGESKQKVIELKKGDIIVFPLGNLTWWYNDGESKFSIVMLGDSSVAVHTGNFSYFFLAGAIGVFNGLSTEFLSTAWGIEEAHAQSLFRSQPAVLLTKPAQRLHDIKPSSSDARGVVLNIEHAPQDVSVKKGGHTTTLTSAHLAMLKEVAFTPNITKLEPNAMRSPGFLPDAAVQVVYVTKGSGRVQIAGTDGGNALSEEVKEGCLFVVPSFFVMSVIAGDEGMEWVALIKTSKPHYNYFTGKTSLMNILTPQILEASLSASPDLVKLLRTKGGAQSAIIPPSN
ncbi:11S globulin seed storage protein 2-like [Typha latifolia]|uniref:11S globulin seed storage protein 2-like n=1 Tax=Typha latifolia TaxID=4733 RepID=UPI003C2D98C5